MEKPVKH